MKKEIEKLLLEKIKYIVNIDGKPITGILTRDIPSIANELANFISSKQGVIKSVCSCTKPNIATNFLQEKYCVECGLLIKQTVL